MGSSSEGAISRLQLSGANSERRRRTPHPPGLFERRCYGRLNTTLHPGQSPKKSDLMRLRASPPSSRTHSRVWYGDNSVFPAVNTTTPRSVSLRHVPTRISGRRIHGKFLSPNEPSRHRASSMRPPVRRTSALCWAESRSASPSPLREGGKVAIVRSTSVKCDNINASMSKWYVTQPESGVGR